MATKLTRLAHKIAIQLHLVAENCSICAASPGLSGYTLVFPKTSTALKIPVLESPLSVFTHCIYTVFHLLLYVLICNYIVGINFS
jgi:hypothetical protein